MALTEKQKNELLLDSGLFYFHLDESTNDKPKRVKVVLCVESVAGIMPIITKKKTLVMATRDSDRPNDFEAIETLGVLAQRFARARRGLFPQMDAEVEVEDDVD